MFAARIDQENLAYDHQRAAAAKSLNQPLGTKTPGNKAPKTPFRKQLNDENDAFNTGFKSGKQGGGLFTKGKKAAELDKNAFITPAGPRNRAPLGMKTTNAKGAQNKTPGPLRESAQKNLSPRLRRPKVKILHEEAQQAQQEPAVPDIEYMAPRSIPLPEYPDDLYLHEENWDMLKGPSLTRGWYDTYMNPVGPDGLTRLQREQKTLLEVLDRDTEATIRKAMANDPLMSLDLDDLSKYFDAPPTTISSSSSAAVKKDSTLKRPPSTLSAKRAASALSGGSTATIRPGIPRFAAPTATANARVRAPTSGPAAAPTSRKHTSATAPTAASMRHAAAAVTSKSTLGYSRGRAVSASTRQPLSAVHSRPGTAGSAATSRSVSTQASSAEKQAKLFMEQKKLLESLITMDPELEMLVVEKNGENESEEVENVGMSMRDLGLEERDDDIFDEEDEESKNFQLEMPIVEEEDEEDEEDEEMKDFELVMPEE